MSTSEKDNLKERPPVVAVVGHVDHGKTALLDHIRKTNIVKGEAGGITQSIGGYEVIYKDKKITFIDTPGHEAFTRMRTHGATAADIAVLVIAADEGVKQQTQETIRILRGLKTPFVVAITKIDKENADPERIKNELASEEVFLEGRGGDVSFQELSSKTGQGIDDLLELILLMGEVLELKYDPTKEASGFVLESAKDPRKGLVANLIVKDGSLKQGAEIKTASVSGKVKILENFLGESAKELEPSAPASIYGFENLPISGEEFVTGDRELEVIEKEELLEDEEMVEDGEERLKAVLKAETIGSAHALRDLIKDEVQIIDVSAGEITDNDIKLARSTDSMIIGFSVKVSKGAQNLAEAQDINIFTSDIIYELLDKVKAIKQESKQEFDGGELEVLATFNSTPTKQTAGGRVLKGKMKLNAPLTIEREGESLGKGRIKSLQADKAEVQEVGVDRECGLVIETNVEIAKGDTLKLVN
ncbi:MAG: translation initiation factor IF-2 [Candidatus Colwellbacteria bacterium CG10_big_fil_rev_8_21_14_0_10_41_28]|uniref:Translation initiation factor IF-2 n=1 Tax=Candidatus Colwellbacteria bacterium CG10_big_fil_rev_8_21_14_0_10_41_28 TaxID=1974539 RepID=A0A2H0VHQ4_9BACT|nr:MAG: translation initiation factor IF-2 [Candidatus Colwellbacteria bacterium CG10_big_fil_rev_8_21_14_0_10_41_28]